LRDSEREGTKRRECGESTQEGKMGTVREHVSFLNDDGNEREGERGREIR